MNRILFVLLLSFFLQTATAQRDGYWQQAVKYSMQIDMDVSANRFFGKQRLQYTNQSPETLTNVFYHLYWNAFQPGSSMDVRSRELGKKSFNGRPDWDARVTDRISKLKPDEIGYQKVLSLKMNGKPASFEVAETILKVTLPEAIKPGKTVVFEMEFEAQVPMQIRRSGRDNPNNGVRYSMSQWYPKICTFDREGWHTNPYIAREFYGEWGDFDVSIEIDKSYKLGGTGILVNATDIGWGYDKPGSELKNIGKPKRTWRFKGERIHDFVWAADPEYQHLVRKIPNGPVIHVIYNRDEKTPTVEKDWESLADAAVEVLPFIESRFGKYPYPQYSFIQGGDGGMEYAMATLINGPSMGTAFHEWMHSWYQMILGTNESLHAWMDEGFTSYAEDMVSNHYYGKSTIQDYLDALRANPKNEDLKKTIASLPDNHSGAYANYFMLVKSGLEEPMTTHADHYNTNFGYSINSYSKGEVFLSQLGYIIGEKALAQTMLSYYDQWKFKHPDPNDFIRVAEKNSGLQLQWYRQYWIHSTKTIDYSIDSLWEDGGKTNIRFRRVGQMPMPLDIKISTKNGDQTLYHIPLDLMMGSKKSEIDSVPFRVETPWRWTYPTYVLSTDIRLRDITRVEIDPTKRMADIERKNNVLELKW
jgi:hypothetical protein